MESFELWLSETLKAFGIDDIVFTPYIIGYLENEESLDDILTDLTKEYFQLKDSILFKWREVNKEKEKVSESGSSRSLDLNGTLATITETQSVSYEASINLKKTQKKFQPDIEVKAAILAQYGNDENEEGSENEDEDLQVETNNNADQAAEAEVEKREYLRQKALAKKEKDKEDRQTQKKTSEDRKKKARERAAKVERKK